MQVPLVKLRLSLFKKTLNVTVAAILVHSALSNAQENGKFDVPPQEAGSALRTAAVQGGFEILIPPKLVEGKRSHELQGSFAPDIALQKMLDGSGLSAKAIGAHTYIVEENPPKSPADKPTDPPDKRSEAGVPTNSGAAPIGLTQLAQAEVSPKSPGEALALPGGHAPATEEVVVSGHYIDTGASSAMKLDIPVRDTPFSVSAYSEAFLKAIETTSVADLYKYMTGIQKAGGTAYDMSIRGFKTGVNDRNAMMVNGLPGLVGRFGSPPTIGMDHIEVVRGPASVLYGQAQPGGFVNLITKKPKANQSGEFFVKGLTFAAGNPGPSLGDKNGYDVALDITGPLPFEFLDNRVLYRFVLENTNNLNAWRNNTFDRSSYVAPTLTWNISDATTVTWQVEYRRARTTYDRGLAPPNKDIGLIAARTTVYQEPGDYQNEEGVASEFDAQHSFANDIKWNFSARGTWLSDYSRGFDNVAVLANLTTLTRRLSWLTNARRSFYYDTNFVLPFSTGFVGHKIIVGMGAGNDSAALRRDRFFTGPATGPQSLNINVYNPIYGTTPPPLSLPVGTLTNRLNKTNNMGFYAADLMTLSEQWKLNLGVRSSDEEQAIADVTNFTPVVQKTARKTVPLAGLLYQPTSEWTLYTSYSESFVPAAVTSVDVNGNNAFVPEESKQIEVGAKADLLEGRLQPTLALFSIKKKDVITTFTCPPGAIAVGTCSQQIGSERSEGIELEVNAQPLDGLQLVVGVSHINPNIQDSADPVQKGALLQNAARNSAHLWSRYDIKGGPMQGFGVGFGVSYTSQRAGNLPTSADPRVISLPAYSIADLAFYYGFRNYDFSLKIANLFDKTYYESTGATPEVQVQPGAPRNVLLTMRTQF